MSVCAEPRPELQERGHQAPGATLHGLGATGCSGRFFLGRTPKGFPRALPSWGSDLLYPSFLFAERSSYCGVIQLFSC